MAYSFTDSEEKDVSTRTMMVPFVDLLNHHSHHHAELSFFPDRLELVTVRDIEKVCHSPHGWLCCPLVVVLCTGCRGHEYIWSTLQC